jgi:ketosteroid isomerase-like protein
MAQAPSFGQRHNFVVIDCARIQSMKAVTFVFFLILLMGSAVAQNAAQKIFETEKAFEKMVAEKGINAAFIEFMAPDGVIFAPDLVNGREAWKKRPPSPAALTWNPVWIEVSSNGALAYSIGNGIYRSRGADDPNLSHTHYLSVWSRQPNGEYRAVMDTGITHDKPPTLPTEWKSPTVSRNTNLPHSAGDYALNFYSTVEKDGAVKAYKAFLAEDAFLMRDGSLPFVGKKGAVEYLESTKPAIKFAKRKTFIEAGDLAWVYNVYSITDRSGAETERGHFIQVWKLRDGKWQIAADILAPNFVKPK